MNLIALADSGRSFNHVMPMLRSIVGATSGITASSSALNMAKVIVGKHGYQHMLSGKFWISFYPGIAPLLTVVAISLIGDRLRDVLTPLIRIDVAAEPGQGSVKRVPSSTSTWLAGARSHVGMLALGSNVDC